MAAHDLPECTSWGKKSGAGSALGSFLVEVRADGTPSAVLAVRSDNRRNIFGGGGSGNYATGVISSKSSSQQTDPRITV